ncbi:MAG: hypothetical protein V4534_08855 [Myxococcota bacterium]
MKFALFALCLGIGSYAFSLSKIECKGQGGAHMLISDSQVELCSEGLTVTNGRIYTEVTPEGEEEITVNGYNPPDVYLFYYSINFKIPKGALDKFKMQVNLMQGTGRQPPRYKVMAMECARSTWR